MKFEERFEDDFSFSEREDTATGEKRMRILATVQVADKVNKNGRIYPKKVLDSAAAAFQSRLKGRGFGQVDHPIGKGKLRDTSHIITKLFWDTTNDKKLNAEMLVLGTPSGQVLKELVQAGGKPGLSSRGKGIGKKEKINGTEAEVIQPGFRFDSFDFCIDPSVTSAKIKRVFESANSEDSELLERVHRQLQAAAGIKIEDVKVADTSRFHKELKGLENIKQEDIDSFHASMRAMAGVKKK